MITLSLIGIGTGNLDHLTGQAIREINRADIVLIPQKGAGKADLADLRHAICAEVLTNPNTKIIGFDLPKRDADTPSYYQGVDDWHDAIAAAWHQAIAQNLGASGRVALLVWGDPSLYDSSLRISKRLIPAPKVEVVAGLTSLQLLTAAHAIALNDIGAPVVITTGRQLRDHGWPKGVDTVVVMLDGACAFQTLETKGIDIWWGAYLGMQNQLLIAGPLEEKGPTILETRAKARQNHGWVMDIYLMRKSPKVKS
ncbi:MAG: precorrin-6A synthase (deacetylating) [Paracoccaceae bacterium]|jgi:precorrin-6A synthase|nr:MAG: precorrin 6A synthase [Rhodobacter sp. BACL10 MAG-121220-bin24]KRO88470.1 MAG: precorrin 6A synthase [Rhodobacter sp. BACL10 MAG-120910-bin24]KRP25435.1 MAG: precorrin 6A synthase [Rhodobacter sp. BACL10 MAG-120419-bin15]MDA0355151.1 precorrin-6A synthase (deacetylating) [Pseudomonadota bacterium]MDO7559613.1 precorrin-6A synthase (deacetylating) [Paracoccaceae bacterium]HAG26546.1 precorrin-6A synthase (deacetylating) [Rhodobacter sp.]|tara:strand:+ start:3049 stop:3810 length:762 start_codon:yes stop_codon:yes gene_type:complete